MNRTIITAPRLFDGRDRVIEGGAAIVIDENRIIYAGKQSELSGKTQEHLIAFEEGTILPGLIDAHVHLTMDGSDDPVTKAQTDSIATASFRAVQNAARQIKGGVTTVRDCGSQGYIAVDLAIAVKNSIVEMAPRIIACGPAICITGGHGSFVGMEADGPEEMRKAVRTVIKKGASFIKVITTGGVLTRGTNTITTQMSKEELEAVAQEAHKFGVLTTTHAHAAEGIKLAIKAGFDSIDHATYWDEEIIQLFKETKAFCIPTLLSSVRQMEHLDEIPSYIAEKIKRHIDKENESVSRYIEAGVSLAGATDAGTPFNMHGDLAEQLLLLSEHGLNNRKALQAGTYGSACAIGLEKETGSLENGKSADILVVKGDPLENLHCLKNIQGVWREGKHLL
ncbi:MAG: amidohydrolase family protein [Clostridiaceae bacterium]